jgi:hypothetical protein
VVGWKGKAIVIPGHCRVGKTTLVMELVRAGAAYYSDEYAVFDARGRVHPFPVRMDERDESGIHRRRYLAESLGGVSGVKALPVGLVVVSEFKPGARWRPQTLSTGQAVLALMANTAIARKQPLSALATLERAVAGAPALKSSRGEASEVAASLLAHLDRGNLSPVAHGDEKVHNL